MSVRVAVIGTGNAARHHVAAVNAAGLELTAVAGRNAAKTAQFVSAICPQAEPLTFDEVLTSRTIDAVIIALPAAAQPPMAIAAFKSGKHVLCEKPLAVEATAAEAIERAWRASGKVGMVNFCFRLIPEFEAFKAQLRSGVCGELNLIRAEWVLGSRLNAALPHSWKSDASCGGGVLQTFGSHVVDYLFHDKPLVHVLAARRNTLIDQRSNDAGARQAATADETATVLFDVPGLCPVFLHVSTVTTPPVGHHVVAQGHKGTLTLFNTSRDCPGGPFELAFSSAREIQPLSMAAHVAGTPGGISLSQLFERVLARFAAAIQNGLERYEPDISDGVRATALIAMAGSR